MTSAPARPAQRQLRVPRTVFLVTAVISLVSIGIEFVYTAFGLYAGADPSVLARLVQWISYVTEQSNLFVIVSCLMLAGNPVRDGRVFRFLRMAGVVYITVTFLVYMVALRPSQELEGIHVWTNAGYHIVVPILVVVGWLIFGPFPRFDWRTFTLVVLWVIAWIAWTAIHGALLGWYPYAMLNAGQVGYPVAIRDAAVVAAVTIVMALLYVWLDRIRSHGRERRRRDRP